MTKEDYAGLTMDAFFDQYQSDILDKIDEYLKLNMDELFEEFLFKKYNISTDELVSILKEVLPEKFV